MSPAQQEAIRKATEQTKKGNNILKDNEQIKGFVAQKKEIETALRKKNPLLGEYYKLFLEQEKNPGTYIGRLAEQVKEQAVKMEILDRAINLCKDEADKAGLREVRNQLAESGVMKSYQNYLEGLKYVAGMTDTLRPEIKSLFANELRTPIASGKEFMEIRSENVQPTKDREELLDRAFQKGIAQVKAQKIFGRALLIDSKRALDEQVFGDWPEKQRENNNSPVFRGRNTPLYTCIGKLVADGYNLEDILDPNKLIDEKAKVGDLYKSKLAENDSAWYAQQIYQNAHAMMDAIQKYVMKYKDELTSERGFAHHANRLGIACHMCFDAIQEIDYAKEKDPDFVKNMGLTNEGLEELKDRLMQYRFATLPFEGLKQEYSLWKNCADGLYPLIVEQIQMENLYKEISKEKPDLDHAILSVEGEAELRFQPSTIPELKPLMNESGNMNDLSKDQVKFMIAVNDGSFVKEQKMGFQMADRLIKVTERPETIESYSDFVPGKEMRFVLVKDGKQYIKTDIPADMGAYFTNMEKGKGDFRGKAKDNSNEFNSMIAAYDAALSKLGSDSAKNVQELQGLKSMASAYILAKREQKGYTGTSVDNKAIDDQMLGKAKGASIFTSRGKERYEFAAKIVETVTQIENAMKEPENVKDTEMVNPNPEDNMEM